jgi:hypothetical protein
LVVDVDDELTDPAVAKADNTGRFAMACALIPPAKAAAADAGSLGL